MSRFNMEKCKQHGHKCLFRDGYLSDWEPAELIGTDLEERPLVLVRGRSRSVTNPALIMNLPDEGLVIPDVVHLEFESRDLLGLADRNNGSSVAFVRAHRAIQRAPGIHHGRISIPITLPAEAWAAVGLTPAATPAECEQPAPTPCPVSHPTAETATTPNGGN